MDPVEEIRNIYNGCGAHGAQGNVFNMPFAILCRFNELQSQLSALRVERDRAWNERFDAGKLSALDTVAKSFEAGIFSGRWTSKDVGRALREIHDVAARPIPAEPVSRKESPNGVD
jgi:hypothetical protein